MAKLRIVLDADVLIHFAKAQRLCMLPEILPEYDHIVLNVVYGEIKSIQRQLDNQIYFMKNISIEQFTPQNEMMLEYARLRKTFGKGESACMAYCKFTHNVVGSSNLKDIKDYCAQEGITYLTTLDFLYYAFQRNKMSEEDCRLFILDVQANGSILPMVNITSYLPNNPI